ncbi:Uncharacterised protein [Porphyromonas macacae]|uniref:Fimbrillin n=1 Tax=Porphyromonas macacae TaxID=28115 RepID=A0A1Y1BWH1_9PORP|nr:Mfa1 family fimbria major subunit [Porphyromonas macacae]BAX64260.1 fimbrillin [Porphyromonas macacae]SUB89915.1 Uncharacterised protein [Porphyromonas macacae]
MKIINKFFLLGVGVLLTLGVVSCNNEKEPNTSQEKEAKTYMALSLNMPMGSFRANADGQDKPNPDFNYVGKWAGKDLIKTISVYMIATDNSSIEKQEDLNYGDYYNAPTPAGDDKVVLTPKKGVKVTTLVGKEVVVYVLLNASDKAKAVLNAASAADFKQKYKDVIELSTKNEALATSNIAPEATAAGKIAKKNGTDNETIMMTCLEPSSPITLEQYVTELDALAGVKNQAKVSVERTVARVMVSIGKESYEIKDKVTQDVIGTLKEIRYVVAQGERKVFISKNSGDPTNNTWKTPGSDFVPNANNFHTNAADWYDYASLWEEHKSNDSQISGTLLPTIDAYNQNKETVTTELEKSLSGKFLLPNTHKFGATKDLSNYKKGNTAYILVRAKFDPKPEIFADKGKVAYKSGDDFYIGTNGKFYAKIENVRDPEAGGVKGMNANKYVKGKVLYFAWLNPDKNDDKAWLNSPVVRNNIYHVHISGFKSIGVNWNPLVPNPNPDDPKNPNNPDPNPNEPGYDPKDNPIKPEDPLSNDDTYMSVQVTVLPWLVHSYSIELGF